MRSYRMKNLKVIAMDMDGTLLTANQEILPYTKEVLMKLQKRGISLVLASGRDIDSLKKIGQKLNLSDYSQNGYICLNGLEIYDAKGNQLHQEKKLQFEDASVLANLAKTHNIDMILFFEECLYIMDFGETGITEHHFMNSKKYKTRDISQIPSSLFKDLRKVAFIQKETLINEVIPILQKDYNHQFDICKVEPDWVEINPYGMNKGTALMKYAKIKNISTQHVLAFGNGENDISMLKLAGKGIAMANSFENVKAIADDICGDNEHDGIGIYLQALL